MKAPIVLRLVVIKATVRRSENRPHHALSFLKRIGGTASTIRKNPLA